MNHEEELKAILFQNEVLTSIFEKASILDLPDWYLEAGAIAQTVWNHKNGFDLSQGIKDYDLVYLIQTLPKRNKASMTERQKNCLEICRLIS